MEVLSSFDNSHNRCGMYLGKFYVAPDALISKETMITYFYKPNTTRRYKKARELGFVIYNFTPEQNAKLDDIVLEPKETPVFSSYIGALRNNITFVKDWDRKYMIYNEFNTVDEFNLSEGIDKLYFEFRNNDLESYILEPTNIPGLSIKRQVTLVVDLELKALDTPHKLGNTSELVRLKKKLLQITTLAHNLKYTPEHILSESRSLITRNEYREVCLSRRIKLIDVVNKCTGFPKSHMIRDIQNGRHIDRMYNNYNGLRLYKYLGYEYEDYIKLNDDDSPYAFLKSTTIPEVSDTNFKKYRVMCIGKKSSSKTDKYLTFGYWNYKILE
jgi:hypothetical protein